MLVTLLFFKINMFPLSKVRKTAKRRSSLLLLMFFKAIYMNRWYVYVGFVLHSTLSPQFVIMHLEYNVIYNQMQHISLEQKQRAKLPAVFV